MSLLSLIKEKIFADVAAQNALIAAFPGSQNFEDAFSQLFFKSDDLKTKDDRLQKILAPFLRSKTIQHMREAESDYAVNFRQAFLEQSEPEELSEYLDHQSQAGVWGTEVEAGALADLLDLTVMVTPITEGVVQSSLIARQSSMDPTQPIVHLYNANNVQT